jgi:hypothetical protein
MHKIDYKHAESVESKGSKPFYKCVLGYNQVLIVTQMIFKALTTVGTHEPSPIVACTLEPFTVFPKL